MGIFQSVKNLVESSEKENEMRLLRESRIVELKNKKLGNATLVRQIIDQFQNNQIVSFGENIDTPDLYQSFEIDKNECLILAICKKKGLILSEEQPYFVLTDVALYFHLESTSGAPRKKRIVVREVIKYIVDYDVIDGLIGMYSENESIVILKNLL